MRRANRNCHEERDMSEPAACGADITLLTCCCCLAWRHIYTRLVHNPPMALRCRQRYTRVGWCGCGVGGWEISRQHVRRLLYASRWRATLRYAYAAYKRTERDVHICHAAVEERVMLCCASCCCACQALLAQYRWFLPEEDQRVQHLSPNQRTLIL